MGRGREEAVVVVDTICLQTTAVADLEDKPQPRPNFLALGSVREMPQASIRGVLSLEEEGTGLEES